MFVSSISNFLSFFFLGFKSPEVNIALLNEREREEEERDKSVKEREREERGGKKL